MEEESKKETRLNKKKERKEKRQKIWNENKELIIQGGIAILGLLGTVAGVIGIVLDHKMTKEDIDYERAVIHDNICDVNWYLDKPLTNEEQKELIQRENDGEFRMEILEDMGKI